jgi:hypothetical protein
MRVRHLFPLVAIGLALTAAAGQAQTLLRYKFVKGQTSEYEWTLDLKLTHSLTGMAGNPVESEVKLIIVMSQTVNDVAGDGSARITTKFTRVKLPMTRPVALVLDSADLKVPDDNPTAKALASSVAALAKVEFSYKQLPTGETADVKPAVLSGSISSVQFIDIVSMFGVSFPKDAVAVGESWTQKTKLAEGRAAIELKNTLRGAETVDGRACQKITYVATTSFDRDPAAAVQSKVKSQKGNGTVLFDNELGRTVSLSADFVYDLTAATSNFAVEQTVQQKVTLRLIK